MIEDHGSFDLQEQYRVGSKTTCFSSLFTLLSMLSSLFIHFPFQYIITYIKMHLSGISLYVFKSSLLNLFKNNKERCHIWVLIYT